MNTCSEHESLQSETHERLITHSGGKKAKQEMGKGIENARYVALEAAAGILDTTRVRVLSSQLARCHEDTWENVRLTFYRL